MSGDAQKVSDDRLQAEPDNARLQAELQEMFVGMAGMISRVLTMWVGSGGQPEELALVLGRRERIARMLPDPRLLELAPPGPYAVLWMPRSALADIVATCACEECACLVRELRGPPQGREITCLLRSVTGKTALMSVGFDMFLMGHRPGTRGAPN